MTLALYTAYLMYTCKLDRSEFPIGNLLHSFLSFFIHLPRQRLIRSNVIQLQLCHPFRFHPHHCQVARSSFIRTGGAFVYAWCEKPFVPGSSSSISESKECRCDAGAVDCTIIDRPEVYNSSQQVSHLVNLSN